MKSTLTMGRVEWALLVLLSVLWGGSFFFAKFALGEFPPLTLVLLRVLIAAIALGAYLVATRQTFRPSGKLILAFAGMGILNNLIPFSLLFWGKRKSALVLPQYLMRWYLCLRSLLHTSSPRTKTRTRKTGRCRTGRTRSYSAHWS